MYQSHPYLHFCLLAYLHFCLLLAAAAAAACCYCHGEARLRRAINEQPLVFLCFLLFSYIAQDSGKSFKNAPKMVPESLQESPKPFQDPSKTPQDSPKTPPRRLLTFQDAPKARSRRAQDAPRLPKTPQESPITPPRPLQSSFFERLGGPEMRFCIGFSKLPSPPAYPVT